MTSEMKFERAIETKIEYLYHYQPLNLGGGSRDLERLTEIISQKRIYCSNPKNFNDPWDISPCPKEIGPDDFQKAKSIIFQKGAQLKIPADILAEMTSSHKKVQEFFYTHLGNVTDDLSEQVRVYCLTESYNNMLMWAHYASNHSGICLEFRTDNVVFGSAWKVKYTDGQYDTLDKTKDPMSIALTKGKDWQYENEYRLLPKTESASRYIEQPFFCVDKEDKISIPNNSLKSIIIGFNAKQDVVEKLIRNIDQDIEIKKSVKLNNKQAIELI